MAFEHLLSPIQIGPRRLRNRVQITAHTTFYIDGDSLPDDRAAPYYGERAKGGVALMSIGTTAVHPSSSQPSGVNTGFDDRVVPRYQRIADAVHAHDGVILVQLGHMAQRTAGQSHVLWSPSATPVHSGARAPRAMTRADIREIRDAFATATRRALEGSLDGVELAFGHGQLVNLFFSPLTNRRTDEYGGPLENRLRFGLEVLEAVRDVAGPSAILGLRINGEDGIAGGLTQEDWLEIGARLAETGIPHYLNVSVDFSGSVIPTMHSPHGNLVGFAAAMKQAVSIPVFCASRIVDPRHAEQIIADGLADMVGMTRAHIADPHLVRKIEEGRPEEIRPCVGCVQMCQGELHRGRGVKCVYNAVTGFEAERAELPPAKQPRRVVVVGGGPAGMEAARVAAERGHNVILLEKGPRLGGFVPHAAAPPGRGELAVVTDWLAGQVRRLEIDVRTGTEAGPETVRALQPDAVIVATGAQPARPAWAHDSDRVVSVRDVVSGAIQLDGTVVVVDEEHQGQALVTASLLSAQGCTVTVISERMAIAQELETGTRTVLYRELLGQRGTLAPHLRPQRLENGALVTVDIFTGNELRFPADWVVTTGARSVNNLAADLADAFPVTMIGDARAPRRIESAVHEAFVAAAML